MADKDWKREMDEMLAGFNRQAIFSLRNISRCFEKSGRPFGDEFRKEIVDCNRIFNDLRNFHVHKI